MRRCTVVSFVVVLTILAYKSYGVSGKALSEENIPARARKAGGTLKRKFEDTTDNADKVADNEHAVNEENHSGTQSDLMTGGSEGEEDTQDNQSAYYDEDESGEGECPEDQYWHVRGLRCVPNSCPGGNKKRDKDTGECLHIPVKSFRGYRSQGVYRSTNPNSRTRMTFRIFRG